MNFKTFYEQQTAQQNAGVSFGWYNDKGLQILASNSQSASNAMHNLYGNEARGSEYAPKVIKNEKGIAVRMPLPDMGAGGARQSIALSIIGKNSLDDIKNLADQTIKLIIKGDKRFPSHLRYALEKVKGMQ